MKACCYHMKTMPENIRLCSNPVGGPGPLAKLNCCLCCVLYLFLFVRGLVIYFMGHERGNILMKGSSYICI